MATKKKSASRKKPAAKKAATKTEYTTRTVAVKKSVGSAVVRAKKFLKAHAAETYAKALLVRDVAKTKKEKRVASKKVVAARAAYKKLL